MESNDIFVDICYYKVRNTFITHIRNINDLSIHLKTTPKKLRDYIITRLNTSANIEGNTIKVYGLLTTSVVDMIVDEMLSGIK